MTDFQMGPLTLSVKSYADDVSEDFYEANWLVLDVKCPTDDGDVAFQSPCLMTTDIFDFMDEINDLLAGQGRQAYLVSLEPQVDVRVGHDLLARGRARVRHDIHFQRRLVRERKRVVLHARRATEIAQHHHLHALPRPGGRARRPATTGRRHDESRGGECAAVPNLVRSFDSRTNVDDKRVPFFRRWRL